MKEMTEKELGNADENWPDADDAEQRAVEALAGSQRTRRRNRRIGRYSAFPGTGFSATMTGMGERLLVVADAFELAGRGATALVPALDWDGDGRHRDLDIELRLPDGRRLATHARLMVEHFFPGGVKRIVHVCLPKAEVPPGTEVWTTDG